MKRIVNEEDRGRAAKRILDCTLLAFINPKNSAECMKEITAAFPTIQGFLPKPVPSSLLLEMDVALFLYRDGPSDLGARFQLVDDQWITNDLDYDSYFGAFSKFLFSAPTSHFFGPSSFLPKQLLRPVYALDKREWPATNFTPPLAGTPSNWVKAIQRACSFCRQAVKVGLLLEDQSATLEFMISRLLTLLTVTELPDLKLKGRHVETICTALLDVVTDLLQDGIVVPLSTIKELIRKNAF